MASKSGLQGRVALVTGVDDEIAAAVALGFAREGVHVAVTALDGAGVGEAVAAQARALGVEAVGLVGDLADVEVVGALVEQVTEQLGPIDVLVHCMGTLLHHPVAGHPVAEWHRALDANCSSFFYLARVLLPTMTELGFGRLVAVGIALDDRARVDHASISAARGALGELVRVVAVESGGAGVTANIVSVAITEATRPDLRTPEMLRELVPVHRPATLDEVAAACTFLASDQAAYITGQTVHVDGGFTI